MTRRRVGSAPGGILTTFALRSLVKNRARTIVSIVGATLACALITAIFTSAVSMNAGLRRTTMETEGSWHYMYAGLNASGVKRAEESGLFSSTATVEDYGAVALPFNGADYQDSYFFDTYLAVQSYLGAGASGGLSSDPEISAGRAPEHPGEVILPEYMRGMDLSALGPSGTQDGATYTNEESGSGVFTDGPLEVGSTIRLTLGTRTCTYGGSTSSIPSAEQQVWTGSDVPEPETLVDTFDSGELTVVGFTSYNTIDPGYMPTAYLYPTDELPVRSCTVLTRLADNAYQARAIELFEDDDAGLVSGAIHVLHAHDMMLAYDGMYGNGAIWTVLMSLAAILTALVMVAGISLIYNAFAISVGERMRQYGLLASLGASKRQLRGSVYAEGCLLALISISAGLALGLAGTWVVFRFTGAGVAALMGYAEDGANAVVVSPVVLAFAAAVSFATIMVSAAVPAWRVSRAAAIDVIRERGTVRRGWRERRRSHRGPGRIARLKDFVRLRLLGAPAWLAHRNITRASSKARVAVGSLAVAVMLMVSAGTFSSYMHELRGVVDDAPTADVQVTLSESVAASLDQGGRSLSSALDRFDAANKAYQGVSGVKSSAWYTSVDVVASAPAHMIERTVSGENQVVTSSATAFADDDWFFSDGTFNGRVGLIFLDDAQWKRYVNQLMDKSAADEYLDPAHPLAIAYNYYRVQADDDRYAYVQPYQELGTLTLYTDLAMPEGTSAVNHVSQGQDGMARINYVPADTDEDVEETGSADGTGQDPTGTVDYDEYGYPSMALTNAARQTYELPVGTSTQVSPESVNLLTRTDCPYLVLSVSALKTIAASVDTALIDAEQTDDNGLAHPFTLGDASQPTVWAEYTLAAKDSAAVTAAVNTLNREGYMGEGFSSAYATDVAGEYRQQRMAATAIQAFTGCFALAMGLIAVANVFNTISTSMILRRREFAMLKSMGMGPAAFRRMIVHECVVYAVRGLVWGLVLSVIPIWFMWNAMAGSFSSIALDLSVWWVMLSCAGILCVLAVSVAYALRVSRVSSVVDALRQESF